VNLGVFRLYGDDALDKALDIFVKLLVSIPLKTLLVRWHLIVIVIDSSGKVELVLHSSSKVALGSDSGRLSSRL